MNTYRITKYNPCFRNENGWYIKDDWTDISDVGSSFEETVLTFEEYKKVEDAYVQTIMLIMNVNDINILKIKWCKKSIPCEYFSSYPDLNKKSVRQYISSLKNRMTIMADQIPLLVRVILRNMFGGKLYNNKTMYVHFGYDYYMYIGSKVSIDEVYDKIVELGLFVEEMNSPYLNGYERRYYGID